jgi:hypothetical protein
MNALRVMRVRVWFRHVGDPFCAGDTNREPQNKSRQFGQLYRQSERHVVNKPL